MRNLFPLLCFAEWTLWHHHPMPKTAPDTRSGAQAVERALAVLQAFEAEGGELRLSELASRTGLSVSTTHRIVRALCAGGVLMQNPESERYALGPALVVLGQRAQEGLGYDRALPALSALSEVTGESVNLGVRSGSDVLVVLDVASNAPLRFDQPAGTRVPVHTSAMGKCLLAFGELTEQQVAELPELAPMTDRTITVRARLLEELDPVRSQGWAVNDEERTPGVRAIAAPVLRSDGTVVAAVAIQGPAIRIDDARLAQLRDTLLASVSDLAAVLVSAR